MTGASQGGAGKRHRTTAPLTPDPFRTQKSAETLPWTLLGATLVGALRKTARGGAPNFFTPAVSVQPKPQTLSRNFTRIPPLGNASSPDPKKVLLPLETRWTVDLLSRTSVATRQKPHPAASLSMMRAPDQRQRRVLGLSNPRPGFNLGTMVSPST